MKTRKTSAIFLTLILAVSMLGIGAALWSKTLYVQGNINTGSVDLRIINIVSDDYPDAIDPGYDKDVACTTVQIDPDDDKRAIVTITNAYPCYTVYVHFTVECEGTVPVRLQDIIINAPPELTVDGWNGAGEQLHPGDLCDNTIRVHVEQPAAQNGVYTFTVEFVYVQYNEYVP